VTWRCIAPADDLAFEDVESSEQLSRAEADASAIIEIGAVQWLASTDGSVRVRATTRAAISDPSGEMRDIAQEAIVTRLHEAFLPAPHTSLRFASLAHDLIGADAVRAQQNDLGAPDMLMRCVAILREGRQTARHRA
jgi:hypothetical protein